MPATAHAHTAHDWSQFGETIFISRPPSDVFRAWTDAEELARWLAPRCDVEPRESGLMHLGWDEYDEVDRVLAIDPDRQLVTTWGGAESPVRVAVTLTPERNGTLCQLHQYGMDPDDSTRFTLFAGCKAGWTFYLTNLKAYLEHGIDLRATPAHRKDGHLNA